MACFVVPEPIVARVAQYIARLDSSPLAMARYLVPLHAPIEGVIHCTGPTSKGAGALYSSEQALILTLVQGKRNRGVVDIVDESAMTFSTQWTAQRSTTPNHDQVLGLHLSAAGAPKEALSIARHTFFVGSHNLRLELKQDIGFPLRSDPTKARADLEVLTKGRSFVV